MKGLKRVKHVRWVAMMVHMIPRYSHGFSQTLNFCFNYNQIIFLVLNCAAQALLHWLWVMVDDNCFTFSAAHQM
jgi:hypothetical protein